jgi:hypothetical protein
VRVCPSAQSLLELLDHRLASVGARRDGVQIGCDGYVCVHDLNVRDYLFDRVVGESVRRFHLQSAISPQTDLRVVYNQNASLFLQK